jgi:polar amino acid transport system ATP-binding protein
MTHKQIPAVEIRGLTKSFGALQVLKKIDVTVMKGHTCCILGPSGSGKSTLLRCVNYLEKPDAGDIIINGENIYAQVRKTFSGALSDKGLSRARLNFGMVFQQFNLWPHFTVLENIIESPVVIQNRKRDEAVAEAEQLLKKVGLSEKRDEYPSRLSGGQKQRVAIARALAMRPQVLLFDEPTSSLDPELVGEVLEVMRDLAREGRTMIVVTHEMDFAQQAADNVVFMDNGHVVESAPPDRFFKSPESDRVRAFLKRRG